MLFAVDFIDVIHLLLFCGYKTCLLLYDVSPDPQRDEGRGSSRRNKKHDGDNNQAGGAWCAAMLRVLRVGGRFFVCVCLCAACVCLRTVS